MRVTSPQRRLSPGHPARWLRHGHYVLNTYLTLRSRRGESRFARVRDVWVPSFSGKGCHRAARSLGDFLMIGRSSGQPTRFLSQACTAPARTGGDSLVRRDLLRRSPARPHLQCRIGWPTRNGSRPVVGNGCPADRRDPPELPLRSRSRPRRPSYFARKDDGYFERGLRGIIYSNRR